VEGTPSDKQVVGDVLEPLEFAVKREWNEQYVYAEEDFHPRYIEETPAGPPLVHPALLLNMSNITRSPSFSLPPGLAAIHTGEECQFLHPARVGGRLKVTWVVRDAYEKRGRPYRVYEVVITGEEGENIIKRTMTTTYVSAAMQIVEKGSP
jgi:acyl dehydratase